MTIDVAALGEPKAPPYAASTPEERLAAAVRLIAHHEALRGERARVPRAQWPGEIFVADGQHD